MSRSTQQLEQEERLMAVACDAEAKQHWYHAAICWRRLGEISNAVCCENILQYLAENNLPRFHPRQSLSSFVTQQ